MFFLSSWWGDCKNVFVRNWNLMMAFWLQIKTGQINTSRWAGLAVLYCKYLAQKAIEKFKFFAYIFLQSFITLSWKGKSTIKCWEDFFGMPPLYKHTVKTLSSGHFDIRKLYLISFEECVFFVRKKWPLSITIILLSLFSERNEACNKRPHVR